MPAARRFVVAGRVQGVFFRDSTRRIAESLGLTGYANNRSDGTVEVYACGEAGSLDRLADWLKSGPPMARVVSVDVEPADCQSLRDFRTG